MRNNHPHVKTDNSIVVFNIPSLADFCVRAENLSFFAIHHHYQNRSSRRKTCPAASSGAMQSEVKSGKVRAAQCYGEIKRIT